ncbi:DUF1266 domain-containing protein [Salinactinospora qingdaonensis]|uniref:DUF1266 domain-containing protein n=1 Tax=Salinactinospora qingdaonensis TaxID=702744 RepID=A0ABP7FPD3_9ACTN
MFTAVTGVVGGLAIVAWAVVAWASRRCRAWLMAPLAVLIVGLVVFSQPGWALLPIVALGTGSFAELVVGGREAPTLYTKVPEAPLSTERWAAAVAAPFRVALAEPWDVVVRPQLRRRYRTVFRREWGIVDRAGLLATVDRVWEELHAQPSADLVVNLQAGTAHSSDSAEGQAGSTETIQLSSDQVRRLREITDADEGSTTVVIAAYQWWKSVHLIRLACGGATLDWLSPAETQNLLRRVASDLQRRYASWRQLAEAFHGGYLLWREGSDEGDRIWTALGLLTRDPASPWNLLPWDMPLERSSHESGISSAQPR